MRHVFRVAVCVVVVSGLSGCIQDENAFTGAASTESSKEDDGKAGGSDASGNTDTDTGTDGDTDTDTDSDTDTDTDTDGDTDTDADGDTSSDVTHEPIARACTTLFAQFSRDMLNWEADEKYFYFMGRSDRDSTVSEWDTEGIPIVEYGPWLAPMIWVDRNDGVAMTGQIETPVSINKLLLDAEQFYVYDDKAPHIFYRIPTFTGELDGDPVTSDRTLDDVRIQGGELFGLVDRELVSMDIETGTWRDWTSDDMYQYHVTDEHVFWVTREDGSRRIMRRSREEGEAMQMAAGDIDSVQFRGEHITFLTGGEGIEGPLHYSFRPEAGVSGLLWMTQAGLDMPQFIFVSDLQVGDEDAVAIRGDYAYLSNDDGELWRIPLDKSSGEPQLLDKWGRFDDDDFDPFVAVDDSGVYWLAGPDPETRATDDDDIGFFKTCLNVDDIPEPDTEIPADCEDRTEANCESDNVCNAVHARPISEARDCYEKPVYAGCVQSEHTCMGEWSVAMGPGALCWTFGNECLPEGYVSDQSGLCPRFSLCGMPWTLGVLPGEELTMVVNALADHPETTQSSDPIPDDAFVTVADGPEYILTFSDDGADVTMTGVEPAEGTVSGYRIEIGADTVVYELTDGLVAGGRLIIIGTEDSLTAELIIFGSGVPVIQSERGEIVDKSPPIKCCKCECYSESEDDGNISYSKYESIGGGIAVNCEKECRAVCEENGENLARFSERLCWPSE